MSPVGISKRFSSAAPALSANRWLSTVNACEKVGVVIDQYCGSCSVIPFLDFDTAGSDCINKRMNKQQGRPCMCARTKQAMRCCTRHRGQTPIACSLEPSMNMHVTITFPPDKDKERKRWRRVRCVRLSAQMSVHSQTQHQAHREWTGL